MERSQLAGAVREARDRSFGLVADLDDGQLIGPRLDIVNPLLWEIGHVAWFQERWTLRHACGRAPIRKDADRLWDSIQIAHDDRWELPLPSREETLDYMAAVRDGVLAVLEGKKGTRGLEHFVLLGVLHEDMHTEAFTYTRQTLGYPPPRFSRTEDAATLSTQADGPAGDVHIDGSVYEVGARPGDGFAFDNEKWVHTVELAPFSLARHTVTETDYAGFVEDDGYLRRELWCKDGWGWLKTLETKAPLYWSKPDGTDWHLREFDRVRPPSAQRPVVHVNWYEAVAYCRWAGRRLPLEAEWEVAARGPARLLFPWGDERPRPELANLDWRAGGTVAVSALGEGDSPAGCRQMIGNVWEWTADSFGPYPGFVADPYKDYSLPWFTGHKVLRGGCWATRSRLIRNSWRNFYTPDRRDVWAGFRTAAAAP